MMSSDHPPYPGLRSFKREETDRFFGRDDCIDAMIGRLAAKRFLAVLGSSGVGKSSLVRTGLLSGLEMGLLEEAGSRWWVVDFRPEDAPMRNLADRLLTTQPSAAKRASSQTGEIADVDVNLLRARLNRSPRSLIEWCRHGHLPDGTNLLLLVDQFEELFRYGDEAGREEAEAFVALLLESRHPTEFESPQMAELPIYVTLTMRSEYLGACSLIEGLAEAVNEGTYLLPRMTREQCREAIVGPARVCGIELAGELVERLLDDLASFAPWDDDSKPDRSRGHGGADQLSRLARRADQLPVMQHALNQMWREAIKDGKTAERGITLTLSEYEAIGKVRGAINRHADDILKRLGPEHAVATEAVFRALTSGTTVANAVRRPTSFGELVKICGAGEPAVRNVVEAFRAPDCNFLLPEIDHKQVLDNATKIDLTHESLIRQWEKLSTWLEKEERAAHDWQRLNEDAGLSELLTGQRLANAIALRDEIKPTAAWAGRYNIDLDRVNSLVSSSVSKETERRRNEAKRRRAVMALLAMAALVCLIFAVVAGWESVSLRHSAEQRLQLAQDTAETLVSNLRRVQGIQNTTVLRFLDVAKNLFERLSSDVGDDSIFAASRADMMSEFGEAYLKAGDGKKANEAYSQSLRLYRTLAGKEPNAILWQRGIADQIDNMGVVLKQEGNYNDARVNFKQALEIRLNVANRDPNNPISYRDIASSYYNVGELDLIQNAPQEALVNQTAALTNINSALGLDKGNRDDLELKLSLILISLGTDYEALGRNDDRLKSNLTALAIRKSLVEAAPDNAEWQRLLSWAYQFVGGSYEDAENWMEALENYQKCLLWRQKLVTGDPGDMRAKYDLAWGYYLTARALKAVGRSNAADYFIEAFKIRKELTSVDEGNRTWRKDLALSYISLGDLAEDQGNVAEALVQFEAARAHL